MIGIDLGIENLIDAVLIGEGGFADVYAATDRRLSRRVAVKVLHRNLTDTARRKFDRECEIMGRLSDHPSVVTVYSAGYTDDGRPYLVMELLDGGSLGQKLKRSGPIPWAAAVRDLIPVAEALVAAHQAGVLHRDIKPDNILISGNHLRLTDFGIAQLQHTDNKTTDEVDASWHHTAPETLDGERDERSDIYSFASTLYAVIAGRSPFSDPHDRSLMSLVHRLMTDPPPKLEAGLGSSELNDFFERALAKDPSCRPQTAEQLLSELRQLESNGHSPAPEYQGPKLASLIRSLQPVLFVAAAVAISGLIGGLRLFGNDRSEIPASAEERGSLETPYPMGQSVTLFYEDQENGTAREWAIQLLEPVVDRTDELAVEPSLPGNRLATAEIRITYRQGTVRGRPADLRFAAIGGTGERFAPTTEGCGSPAGQLDLDTELVVSGAVEGRLCWWVPGDQLASLVLAVEAEPAVGVVYLAFR